MTFPRIVGLVQLLLLLGVLQGYAAAQANQPNHVMPTTNLIDGSVQPDLIPDSTAYRLFFITVSTGTNPKAEEKARQAAFLKSAGLSDEEIEAAVPVLTNFNAEYANLIATYNASVAAANAIGNEPDLAGFLQRRDQLVQLTRDGLGAVIGAEALIHFNAHVQQEKRNIRVAKEVQ